MRTKLGDVSLEDEDGVLGSWGVCNDIYLFSGLYSLVQEEMIRIVSRDLFWGDRSEGSAYFFFMFVQVYSDKIATRLNSAVMFS